MRILVVDDETEMSALVARGLRADGHEVLTAADGISALGLHREDPVDVAVLDIMMPGLDGFRPWSCCSPPATRSTTGCAASTRGPTTT